MLLEKRKEVVTYLDDISLGWDRLGSAFLGWGSRRTMSSHMGTMKKKGELKGFWKGVCQVLTKLDVRHCIKNIGI